MDETQRALGCGGPIQSQRMNLQSPLVGARCGVSFLWQESTTAPNRADWGAFALGSTAFYVGGSRQYFWGKHRPGFVYILLREDGLYKIGCARNVRCRQDSLRTCYGHLVLVHTFPASDRFTAERLLHRYFRHLRIEREWFRLTIKDVHWIQLIQGFIGKPPFQEYQCGFALKGDL